MSKSFAAGLLWDIVPQNVDLYLQLQDHSVNTPPRHPSVLSNSFNSMYAMYAMYITEACLGENEPKCTSSAPASCKEVQLQKSYVIFKKLAVKGQAIFRGRRTMRNTCFC